MNDNRLLDALTCRGVLASVSVRYWRARKKLNPADLGLPDDKVNRRLISLGHKRLLPKERLAGFALVESRTHSLVDASTFPFLNGIARYLPNECLAEVDTALNRLKGQFEQEKQAFLTGYAAYREEALEEWRETARSLVPDPSRLVAAIENAFPPPDRMDRHFGFHVSLFQLAVPDVPKAELVEAGARMELIETRERAAREARRRIEESCEDFVRDCAATLREQTARLCREMLGTIEGTGSVHQRTLNRLIRFVDRFRQLNFVNDAEMETQLESVRKEFLQRGAAEYRDSAHARRELVKGLEALRDRAADMARDDTGHLVEGFGRLGERRFTLVA